MRLMIYLILIGTSIALFAGFLALVSFERSRNARIAGGARNKLDKRVARATFIAQHVDWGAFLKHLLGSAAERTAHDVAHGVLRFVRSAERLLTRFVKYLRARRGMPTEDAQEDQGSVARIFRKVRTAVRRAPRRAPKAK